MRTRSFKLHSIDILTVSLHYFCKKWKHKRRICNLILYPFSNRTMTLLWLTPSEFTSVSMENPRGVNVNLWMYAWVCEDAFLAQLHLPRLAKYFVARLTYCRMARSRNMFKTACSKNPEESSELGQRESPGFDTEL